MTTSARPVMLPVSEQFGPTLQGEGPNAGRAAQFIRLGGCNLSCSWCDTPYTWDEQRYDLAVENPRVLVEQVLAAAKPNMLTVLTGGEPLMHQHRAGWEPLLAGLTLGKSCDVQLETNGTFAPNTITQTYVESAAVSPKLANAGGHRRKQDPTLHPGWAALAADPDSRLGRNTILKFVVEGPADVDAAYEYAIAVRWPRNRVWVMPQGVSVEELQERWPAIARRAADLRINASHRLHVLAWGNTKGT